MSIRVQDLVKRYRGAARNAVDGVELSVDRGQLFCLLGPNGAGKTTILSILTTTLSATAGKVEIAGHDLDTDEAGVRRATGVVFQESSLDLNLTAEENVRLHAILYGEYPWRPLLRLMPEAYRREVRDLAAVLGVEGVLTQPARSLSGGTRRKLEIVRALMHRPAVLFLDEPSAGLDPESRRNLWEYLRDARQRWGTTIFLTTHYLDEAEEADAVSIIAEGRVIEAGSPEALKARLTTREVWVDAEDRERLCQELLRLGLTPASGPGPLRLTLEGHTLQWVLRSIESDLTLLRVMEPSLEDAYLDLVQKARQ